MAVVAHTTGLRHALYVSFPEKTEFEKAWAHASSRRSNYGLSTMRMKNRTPSTTARPGPGACPTAWLEAYATSSSCTNRSSDNMVVPESLWTFRPKVLIPGSQDYLAPWAQALQQCNFRFSTPKGLFLEARTTVSRGSTVAVGFEDRSFVDGGSETSRGTLLGPLSVANSACAKCATVKYNGAWRGVATKKINPGDEITVNYSLHGQELKCKTLVDGKECGVRIRGNR